MYFVLHSNRCFSDVQLGHHGHSHSGDGHGHGHSHGAKSKQHGHAHEQHGHSHEHAHGGANHAEHAHSRTSSHSSSHKSARSYTLPITDNFEAPPSAQQVVVCDEPEADDALIENSSKNINIRAAAVHVIGDFIQSIGVLIAALIIYFKVNDILLNYYLC